MKHPTFNQKEFTQSCSTEERKSYFASQEVGARYVQFFDEETLELAGQWMGTIGPWMLGSKDDSGPQSEAEALAVAEAFKVKVLKEIEPMPLERQEALGITARHAKEAEVLEELDFHIANIQHLPSLFISEDNDNATLSELFDELNGAERYINWTDHNPSLLRLMGSIENWQQGGEDDRERLHNLVFSDGHMGLIAEVSRPVYTYRADGGASLNRGHKHIGIVYGETWNEMFEAAKAKARYWDEQDKAESKDSQVAEVMH